MENEKSLFIQMFGGSPEMRIIDFFLDNKLFDFSKKEIIEETRMSKATFYAHWDRLENLGIIKVSRKFGKAKLYELNKNSPVVRELFNVEKQLIRLAAGKHMAGKRIAVPA